MIILAAIAALTAPQTGPIDWAALPPLPYRSEPRVTPQMVDFVAHEVATNHCPAPSAKDGMLSLSVDVAVLVTGDGNVRVTVPRAINCPTVEQYSAGLVASFARANLTPLGANASQWYRTNLVFAWRQ